MNQSHGALSQLVCVTMLFLAGCGGGSSPSSSPSPPPPSSTYTVGGNVSGLGANDSVTLLNNGGDALVVSGNGGFTFSTPQDVNSTYAVTVQSHTPDITCSVGNGSGSVISSNVTSVTLSCAADKETVLYSFGSGTSDATNPQGGLIMDSDGNLYGTTDTGGTIGVGAVFKISAAGVESVLYSFVGPPTDGGNPKAGLVRDSAGDLYGTTNGGGAYDMGTVFVVHADGTESILHSFAGGPTDGRNPLGGLVMDSAGNLYGTTSYGGPNGGGDGIVFKISTAGIYSILHSFAGSPSDGRVPYAGLTMDGAGNLYGTTNAGGLGAYDFGTVFKISADGTESILHSFTGIDGGVPEAGLIMDSAGNLYGTTTSGGTATVINSGEVFKLSPDGTLSVLHYFTGGITSSITDGGYPRGSLALDVAGNLYGTTSSGGAHDLGTLFVISAAGTITILHSFAGATTDGNEPVADLLLDSTGTLYGTTAVGGANDEGTVFKIN